MLAMNDNAVYLTRPRRLHRDAIERRPAAPTKGLRAPRQCVLSQHRAGTQSSQASATLSHIIAKGPVFRGFQRIRKKIRGSYWLFSKPGTRPAIALVQPSFGDLDTGRSRTPLLYTGTHTAHSDESQNAFGNPGTGRPGIPSLTPGLIPLTATSPDAFGDLDTGRSRLPFFTPGLTPLTATSPKTLLGTLVQAGQEFPL